MPIDTSIYGLIRQPQPVSMGPTPFESAGQMMQIKHLMDQGAMSDLKRAEFEKEVARQGRLRDLFARGNVKPEEVDAIDFQSGQTYRKGLLDTQKSQADLDKTRAETMKANIGIVREMTSRVQTDNGLKLLRDNVVKMFGPEAAADIPPSVSAPGFREWQAREIMQADELLKRLSPELKFVDTGAAQVPTNPYTGKPAGPSIAKTASPEAVLSADTTRRGQDLTNARERDVDLQRQLAGARESGKAGAEAQAALPGVIQNAERGLRLVDELVGSEDGKTKPHAGFQSAVGVSMSKLLSPFWAPPGTDRRAFDARLAEIKGGAFLEAFEKLKGGGQITQIEGDKATQAINRMETALSEAEFTKAAREFQNIIRAGVARAKQKAGPSNPMAPGGASVMAPKPGGGGIKFLGFEGQ